jgi:hypothetical protein
VRRVWRQLKRAPNSAGRWAPVKLGTPAPDVAKALAWAHATYIFLAEVGSIPPIDLECKRVNVAEQAPDDNGRDSKLGL